MIAIGSSEKSRVAFTMIALDIMVCIVFNLVKFIYELTIY